MQNRSLKQRKMILQLTKRNNVGQIDPMADFIFIRGEGEMKKH